MTKKKKDFFKAFIIPYFLAGSCLSCCYKAYTRFYYCNYWTVTIYME